MRLGALEAGGTKMICSVGNEQGEILVRERFDTLSPDETMPGMIEFFQKQQVEKLGIGCFGPLDLNPASPDFGSITTTPKLSWRNYPIYQAFKEALNIPVSIDTDVNVAVLAEQRLGAAQGKKNCLYLTVGTGIGGGVMIDGQLVHGLMHPEAGHFPLCVIEGDPMPKGCCPYHQTAGCAEGLASGTAMRKRWGVPAETLPLEHQAWQMEAGYLAQLCVTATALFSPEIIVLGGGVMQKEGLIELVRGKLADYLGGYWQHPVLQHPEQYLVLPGLGNNAGATGALLLAMEAK